MSGTFSNHLVQEHKYSNKDNLLLRIFFYLQEEQHFVHWMGPLQRHLALLSKVLLQSEPKENNFVDIIYEFKSMKI